MKKLIIAIVSILLILALSGCETEATRVSYNVSKEADNFNVCREIIVVNVRDNTAPFPSMIVVFDGRRFA